jgi:hypothetical protein
MRLRLRTVPALALTAILLATGPFATPAAANGTSGRAASWPPSP